MKRDIKSSNLQRSSNSHRLHQIRELLAQPCLSQLMLKKMAK